MDAKCRDPRPVTPFILNEGQPVYAQIERKRKERDEEAKHRTEHFNGNQLETEEQVDV